MSLLLKAFPRGRPRSRARHGLRALVAMVAAGALVLAVLPSAWTAQARPVRQQAEVQQATAVQAQHVVAKKKKKKNKQAKKQRKRVKRVVGQPHRNYVIPMGSYFAFPNKGKRARQAIRGRVLLTIQSVWGGYRDRYGAPLPTNGRIRIATWTFDDWKVARALVAAKKRGVSVQVLAAKRPNRPHASWRWLREKLGTRLFRKGVPRTSTSWSFARTCRGSCRGRFGTPHSKYFLFDNVGASHRRAVSVQTSANLTAFAFTGQWNQAQVSYSPNLFRDFSAVFWESRRNTPQHSAFHTARYGNVRNYFFPLYPRTPSADPAHQILRRVSCTGAQAGSTGRTSINVNQYAIYGDRGEWLARDLRNLWERGCGVAIIYTVASRPVLQILRSRSGRGSIPMRQSVITNGYGTIVKYNHSKWMTIVGAWSGNPRAYVTFSGSANWANLAMGSDEQMQRIDDRRTAVAHLRNFAATWRQRSSHKPGYGVLPKLTGRTIPTPLPPDVPEDEPDWGKGVFKYMTP